MSVRTASHLTRGDAPTSSRDRLDEAGTARHRLARLGVVIAAVSLAASSCGGAGTVSPAGDAAAVDEAEGDGSASTTDRATTEESAASEEDAETQDAPAPDPDGDTVEETPPDVCPPEGDDRWGTSSRASADWPAGSGTPTVLADALIGAHDGYDRFVLVFDEQTGPLSWAVEVVDGQPVHGASGLELDIDGSAFIEVTFAGLALSMLEPDDQYAGSTQLDGVDAGTTNLVQAVLSSEFEAQVTWHIGYDHVDTFRVFTLESPSRLVVDVCSDGAAGG